MALGEWPALDAPVLEPSATAAAPLEISGLGYWITIQGEIIGSPKVGSLGCELVLNGKGSLSFIVINPPIVPLCGQTVTFTDRGKLYFGGIIQTVTLNTDQSEAVKEFTVEAVGWEGQLERHLVKSSYANYPVQSLIEFAILDADLDADNFSLGYTDPGPPVLKLVDADYVRASDYLRDIAEAGGGSIEISPEKVISFRKLALREAPFALTNAEPEYAQAVEDVDDYVNSVTVLVTGTSGATANIERADTAEIALRSAIEGSSGIYRAYETIQHPSSNDVVELARLGVSFAFLFMQSRARVNKNFTARLRRTLLDVGQLLEVDMPGLSLSGEYQISRMSISDDEGKILYEIEGTATNKRQLNLDSLLRIVRAAKTTIVIPTDEFQNEVLFSAGQTWNVPGAGTVQVEMQALGPGGGGGGGSSFAGASFGGSKGGEGGKAVSFREYTAGTTLTIVIGTGGAGGAFQSNGSAGSGSSYVSAPGESRVAEGFPGGGGTGSLMPQLPEVPPEGSDGVGAGDYTFTGSGSPGGAGGVGGGSGLAGTNGKVIIRY